MPWCSRPGACAFLKPPGGLGSFLGKSSHIHTICPPAGNRDGGILEKDGFPAFLPAWMGPRSPEQPQGPAAARGRARLPHGCWSRVGAAAALPEHRSSSKPLPAASQPPGTGPERKVSRGGVATPTLQRTQGPSLPLRRTCGSSRPSGARQAGASPWRLRASASLGTRR